MFGLFCQIDLLFLDLNRKRKYIPETENYDNDETQCENEEETLNYVFEQNSQSYSDVGNDKPQKKFKNSGTCTEIDDKNTNSVPSIIDLHGCKRFGEFISNELLRFDADQRYIVMQNILEVLKNGDKKFNNK